MTDKTLPDECRVAFERWFSSDYKEPRSIMRDNDGYYLLQGAYNAWTAWQAAWSARVPEWMVVVPVEPNDEQILNAIPKGYAVDSSFGNVARTDYRAMIAPFVKGGE